LRPSRSDRGRLTVVKQVSYDVSVLHRDYPQQVCSVARALEVVGERWTLLILRDAMVGVQRFEDFQESLGIASNVLSTRLKLLCDEGVLRRLPDEQRPGRPKYALTRKGSELGPALIALLKWGDRHYPAPGGPPRLTLHTGCGGTIGPDLCCDRCGKQASGGEIELKPGPGAGAGGRQALHRDA
jgi:DNA-binding HxlR family transcriptional regulator